MKAVMFCIRRDGKIMKEGKRKAIFLNLNSPGFEPRVLFYIEIYSCSANEPPSLNCIGNTSEASVGHITVWVGVDADGRGAALKRRELDSRYALCFVIEREVIFVTL